MLGTGELPGRLEVRTPLRLRWSLARRCASSYLVITTHGAAIPLPVNVPVCTSNATRSRRYRSFLWHSRASPARSLRPEGEPTEVR